MERIGKLEPEWDTRAGRMLAGGRLVATVTSKQTQRHVTLRFRCTAKVGGHWPTMPFAEATHVFIENYDGATVGSYSPATGMVRWDAAATPAAKWTVRALLRYLAGGYALLEALAYIDVASLCGRCGEELTDPESIERGFGPVCWGEATRAMPVPTVA
jgi:hypothetical protein